MAASRASAWELPGSASASLCHAAFAMRGERAASYSAASSARAAAWSVSRFARAAARCSSSSLLIPFCLQYALSRSCTMRLPVVSAT